MNRSLRVIIVAQFLGFGLNICAFPNLIPSGAKKTIASLWSSSKETAAQFKQKLEAIPELVKKGGKAAQEVYQRTLADIETNQSAILQKLRGIQSTRTPWYRIPDETKFNEATIAGSHNAYQSIKYGYKFAQALHTQSITEQLEMGIRCLDLRVWHYNNDLRLCHGPCEKMHQKFLMPTGNFTTFSSVLKEVKEFLDTNKDEVVLISVGGNIQSLDPALIDRSIEAGSLQDYALKPEDWDIIKKHEWPTYGWLRKNNKRAILAIEDEQFSTTDKHFATKYIHSELFAKPRWLNKTTTQRPRLLVLSVGVEMPTDIDAERLVQILSGKEEYHLFGIYSLDYLIRTLAFFRGVTATAPMSKLNTKLPYQYARYVYENGFGQDRLWKREWPTVIASDFVGQGDLFGAAECINKILRGWDNQSIYYPTPQLNCRTFQ